MPEEKSGGDIHVSISGDVSGQVAVGTGITQTQSTGPPQPEAAGAGPSESQSAEQEHLNTLRRTLVTHLDEGELRTLCFELGIDYQDLPDRGKANKARELVAYLKRHGRVSDLIRVGQRLRPDVVWAVGKSA